MDAGSNIDSTGQDGGDNGGGDPTEVPVPVPTPAPAPAPAPENGPATESAVPDLQTQLGMAVMEVRNCQSLLLAIALRYKGIVLTDAEINAAQALARLDIHRDNSAPGCVILARAI